MKQRKRRATEGLLLLFAVILCVLTACQGEARPYLGYREEGFCAEVKGTLNGTAVDTKVEIKPLTDGYEVTVEYLDCAGLGGVWVAARCNESGGPIGKAEVRLSEQSLQTDAVEVRALLLPATAWLTLSLHDRVEKNGEGYLLTFPENICLQLDRELSPKHLWYSDADIWIVWSEKLENISK